jgi:FtsP/CotA-like multicopper oxidase with cupredoxin domain
MVSRRNFLGGAGAVTAAVSAAAVSKVAMAALPEPVIQSKPDTMPPLVPNTGRPYNPVVTLNGWTLPWRMNNGVKEFHLVAEPVVREMAPGFKAHLWGYNGQSPGPTIEVVEGDRVRIFVTNKLGELHSVHWHGQRLPSGMDGVTGLTQPGIPPGKTFVYEFVARRPGTFMYHPHADEMVQMAMGMMGFWITHPKGKHPLIDEVDRDFCFLLNAYDIDPGSYTPKIMTMLDFNLWSWNSRIFPGIDPLVVSHMDKVRIRIGNLTMTNHPIHLHGHEFLVTGTDGGPTPKSTRRYEVTEDIAVGQMRQVEFLADEEGDWAFHCHKSHHTMNAMGHDVPTMIGVDHRGVAKQITKLVPDYMVMGERGMKDMTEMEMPLPDNTAAMMTGQGPFGSVGMGGMFSVVKVRKGQKRGDYGDPGWYKHPPGTVAYEFTGELPDPARFKAEGTGSMPPVAKPAQEVEVKVRKPGGGHGRPQLSGARADSQSVPSATRRNPDEAVQVISRGCARGHLRHCHGARRRGPCQEGRSGQEGTEGLGHRRRRQVRQADHRNRHGRQHAFHSGQHRGATGRNGQVRRAQHRQGHARVRDRHEGRERQACRADGEVPDHGTRRAVHGPRRTGQDRGDRLDLQPAR